MIVVVLGIIAAGTFIFASQKANALDGQIGLTPLDSETKTRKYGLKDVDPSEQGGNYKTEHDFSFETVADEFNIPFALLKAHALQESSLNEDAYRDENPTKREDRKGWASRGLMQLLWADDKSNAAAKTKLYDRFKKYGYSGDQIKPGDILYNPNVNIRIAAQLINDNLNSCGGNLRDAINMYNAGVKESVRAAPGDYVGKVLNYYNKILGV